MSKVPKVVKKAIKCGPKPKFRSLDGLMNADLTMGEKVVRFAEQHLIVPEGPMVGQPLVLDDYQRAFILAVFDNPHGTNLALLSIGRRNGKTLIVAVILLAYIVGPLKGLNTTLASAAQSKEQAATVFELMVKMLDLSPDLDGLYKVTPSSKQIIGLRENVQYRAISAEAKTGHGKAYKIILLDEAGQIEDASNKFVEMLETSQSNYDDAIMFVISTQAPSDAAYFSILLDDAERSGNKTTVSHVYAADPDCDIEEEKQWYQANPGLGKYRSLREMRQKIDKAINLPASANGIMNLNLNMRVSLQSLFMSPAVWKRNLAPLNMKTRQISPIHIGLDLSQKTDLTAAVATWKDLETGKINVETHCFAPIQGVEQREIRDKVPYQAWAKEGYLNLVAGETIEYKWVCNYLVDVFENCEIRSIHFDPYRIDHMKEAAKSTDLFGMVEEWVEVRQGFVTMGVLLDAFEAESLAGNLATGSHPLLNMAASQAISARDHVGNRRLEKFKSTQRIDPLVAAVMAVFPLSDGEVEHEEFSVEQFIV